MAPADLLRRVRALVLGQESARKATQLRMNRLAEDAVRSFNGWYSPADVDRWSRDLAATMESYQRTLARSTDAYLARSAAAISGRSVRAVGAIDVADVRNGVSHADAYARVAEQYRYQAFRLRQDDAPADLVSPDKAALNRALKVADMDAILTVQQQSQKFMTKQPRLTGYRRVIHPELSAGGTCGLCIAASDRLYGPRELMPIHNLCHCVPLPVYDNRDPGSQLNATDLARIYAEAGTTAAEDLKNVRYKVTDNGELGPTLSRADSRVKTAADVEADTGTSVAERDAVSTTADNTPPAPQDRPENAPQPTPAPEATPAPVEPAAPAELPPVASLTDDQLEDAMSDLMSDPDGYANPRMDALADEMDRRDQQRRADAEQARRDAERAKAEAEVAAERAARFEEQRQQQIDEEAERERLGYGAGGKQWRRSGGRGEAALRDEYETWIEVQYTTADAELNGVLLSAAGRAAYSRGELDVRDLFTRKRRSLTWASEELQEWFSRNPRMSYPEFRAGSTDDDAGRAARTRAAGHRWESEFG